MNALEIVCFPVLYYYCYYDDDPGVPIFEVAAVIVVTRVDVLDFTKD